MPAIAKTSDRAIIEAARALVERDGAENLSMQAVAAAVGIRAPSLYKRFTDRAALLAAVEIESLISLRLILERAGKTGDPPRDLAAMARAYRRFARQHPRLYDMLFGRAAPRSPETDRVRRDTGTPVLERMAKLVGEDRALVSMRVLTAFAHGFVSLENAGAYRLGGRVEEAYALGISTLLRSFGG